MTKVKNKRNITFNSFDEDLYQKVKIYVVENDNIKNIGSFFETLTRAFFEDMKKTKGK